jgi:hypothetical protein
VDGTRTDRPLVATRSTRVEAEQEALRLQAELARVGRTDVGFVVEEWTAEVAAQARAESRRREQDG